MFIKGIIVFIDDFCSVVGCWGYYLKIFIDDSVEVFEWKYRGKVDFIGILEGLMNFCLQFGKNLWVGVQEKCYSC